VLASIKGMPKIAKKAKKKKKKEDISPTKIELDKKAVREKPPIIDKKVPKEDPKKKSDLPSRKQS
jgi:hypothetical protein